MTAFIILAIIISIAGVFFTFLSVRKEDVNYGSNKNIRFIALQYFALPFVALIVVGIVYLFIS